MTEQSNEALLERIAELEEQLKGQKRFSNLLAERSNAWRRDAEEAQRQLASLTPKVDKDYVMPDAIYAYHSEFGTGTWIDFDDSCGVSGDVATEYVLRSKSDAEINRLRDVLKAQLEALETKGFWKTAEQLKKVLGL